MNRKDTKKVSPTKQRWGRTQRGCNQWILNLREARCMSDPQGAWEKFIKALTVGMGLHGKERSTWTRVMPERDPDLDKGKRTFQRRSIDRRPSLHFSILQLQVLLAGSSFFTVSETGESLPNRNLKSDGRQGREATCKVPRECPPGTRKQLKENTAWDGSDADSYTCEVFLTLESWPG